MTTTLTATTVIVTRVVLAVVVLTMVMMKVMSMGAYGPYAGLSRLWSRFAYPEISGPLYNPDPKRDDTYDKLPYENLQVQSFAQSKCCVMLWDVEV